MNVKKDAPEINPKTQYVGQQELMPEETPKKRTDLIAAHTKVEEAATKKRMELVEKIVNTALKGVDNLSTLRERRYKLTTEQIASIVLELKKQVEETAIKLTSTIHVSAGRFKL